MGVSIECCVLSVEAGKANCIAWQDRGSKTRSITLDWTTLAIKPPMHLQQYWQYREGGQIKSANKINIWLHWSEIYRNNQLHYIYLYLHWNWISNVEYIVIIKFKVQHWWFVLVNYTSWSSYLIPYTNKLH
jgi:hypothetical protein